MKQREFLEITMPQQVAPAFLVPTHSILPKPAGWIHLGKPKPPQGPPPKQPKPPSFRPPAHLIAQGQAAPAKAAPENAGDQDAPVQDAQDAPVQDAHAQETDQLTEASFSEVSEDVGMMKVVIFSRVSLITPP